MIPDLCLLAPLANASLPTGFCAGVIPAFVNQTRTIVSLKHNSILALERGTDSIIWLSKSATTSTFANGSDSDPNNWIKRTLITEDKINHGIEIDDKYIYASTDENVYRWTYTFDDNVQNFTSIGTMKREHIIYNISSNGTGWTPYGHMTRTLLFSPDREYLYVSVGSSDNVDTNSYRSRIRRFNTSSFDVSSMSSDATDTDVTTTAIIGTKSSSKSTLQIPLDFDHGQVYVDGVRNTVGMAFDKYNVLWGVDNGPSNVSRYDLGGTISEDNPADRLFHFIDPIGKHYGYPYCFTEYLFLNGYGTGRGTSWAWPSYLDGTTNGTSKIVSDVQCQTQYVQATIALQGHSAPLGITFYNYVDIRPSYCTNIQPFPQTMDGYAFIAFHGSAPKSRTVPTGYSVSYIPMPLTYDTIHTNNPIPLLYHNSNNTVKWDDGFRPVDIKFDDCGCLLVSSDGSKDNNYAGSKIVRIHYYDIAVNDKNDTVPTENTNQNSASCTHVWHLWRTSSALYLGIMTIILFLW